MSTWVAKRFWEAATVFEEAGRFGVRLYGKRVMTPAKAPLLVPTQALAELIVAEWLAQDGVIDPKSMPFTRSANAAIDKVHIQHEEVACLVAQYGGSDLLCYRAASPAELVARQAGGWDPVLNWAAENLDARLRVGTGIVPVAQDPAVFAALLAQVSAFDAFGLTGLHDLVSLSGSLILGLAVTGGRLDRDTAWALSRIDESWQEEQWGKDDEACDATALKHQAFTHAETFLRASKR